MKIAYMIIAHEQPDLLGQLVARLKETPCDVYIHIDRKKDIGAFEAAMPYANAAIFIKNRIAVAHGGFSLARAVLSLLDAAAQDDKYDLYHCLSGRDYPIKSAAERISFHAAHPGIDFIQQQPLFEDSALSQNIYQYHFVDFIHGLPPTLMNVAVRVKKFLNRARKRKFVYGFTPYRGSCWTALTRRTVRDIQAMLATPEGRKLRDFFRFSWGSDEIMIHTLAMNSKALDPSRPYNSVTNAKPGVVEVQTYLHYVDWSTQRENPAILSMQDYEKIRQSDALFGRKFCLKKSATLLAALDEDNGALGSKVSGERMS